VPKRIFFIAPYPFGAAPSQRFRFEQYFTFLKEQGYEIEEHPFYDEKTWKTLYSQGKILKKAWGLIRSFARRKFLLFRLHKADHIFIHREVAHIGPPIFEWIIAKVLRRKYIYDFDDAIWLPNYSETNARFHRLKAYWKVNYCMKWAHQVTAGNEYLANYARKFNQHVQVIPTTIDTEGHHNVRCDHDQIPVIIGWTGTHTTMRYLDPLIPILKDLEKTYNFRFRVISNQTPEFELKSLEYVPWNKETEIEDLAQIQIGIMPLEEDIWSEGKCGFKGLQYMALGMATILSPVGVNKTIVKDAENGFLADDPQEWKEKMARLLKDTQLRKELGASGRATIEEYYSSKSNKKKYIKLFDQNSI
jgi:glycosyltransferase involved in cell wall biosynthesis